MPTMQDTVSVAANGVSANVISGQFYENVPRGALVRIYAVGAATGIRATVLNGVPVVQDQAIKFNATTQFPVIPDDLLTEFRAPGGKLDIRFRNTTAGPIVTGWRVDLI